MGGIAVGLIWSSYFLGFWGYCLLKNYNVTPGMLLSPNWPPTTVDNGPAYNPGGTGGNFGPNPGGKPGPNMPGGGTGPGARLPGGGSAGI